MIFNPRILIYLKNNTMNYSPSNHLHYYRLFSFWKKPRDPFNKSGTSCWCHKMSPRIIEGPPDNSTIPRKSLGAIFYEEMQKWSPDKIAMVDTNNEEINYKTFLETTVKIAKSLKNLGVKKNDIITIISPNQWRHIATIIACFYVGATANPLNPGFSVGELKRFLSICKPVVIFCTSATMKNILPLKEEAFFPSNIICYNSTDKMQEIKTFEELLMMGVSDVDFTPVAVNPTEDVAQIMASSGTVGFPKCVQLTHSNYRLTLGYSRNPAFFDISDKDNFIGYLPLFQIWGNVLSLATLLFGSKLVFFERFQPDTFLATIQKHKITKLYLVPPILLFLIRSPIVQNFDMSSVVEVTVGGDSVGKEVLEKARKLLKTASVRQVYGMTELCGGVTLTPKHPKHDKKLGSCGKVTPSHKIKVCAVETGEMLPPNEVGEIRFTGDGIMKGYLGNAAATKEAFDEDGYLRSGDIGYYDEEEYFYIKGRLKEIIKYESAQVSPAELESLLLQHPAVKDVGVVGKPDERAGELAVAFVVKHPDKNVTEEEIVKYVAENISPQKHLYGGVRFVEEIPKNALGKIVRGQLKKWL